MDTATRIALAGLALCDALDDGAIDSGARIMAVETARRHYHAVIAATMAKQSSARRVVSARTKHAANVIAAANVRALSSARKD